MSKKTIRVCDICHKTEGRELKTEDFVNEALQMTMNGIDGDVLTISCNISIKRDNANPDYIIENVVNDYAPMEDVGYINEATGTNLNYIMAEKQLNVLDDSMSVDTHHSDICKVCFNNMVKMMAKYAKWNEKVHF